ncbi:MAG: hypothetical protein QN194_14960 [Armatimonadota bacterium]|nr:hypothetical protein [Armatimonadota bacterium]
MSEDIIKRFTSRKFLAAAAAFVASILSTAGVIDASQEAEVAGYAAVIVYVIVEGVLDLLAGE